MGLRYLSDEELSNLYYWKNYFESNFDFKFLRSSYQSVPYVSKNYDGLNAKYLDQLEYALLSKQFIDMGTNDDEEIRKIRTYHFDSDEVALGFNEFNKLTRGYASGVCGCLGLLSGELATNIGDDIVKNFPKNYNHELSFEHKCDYFRIFDSRIYSFLEKLA